MRTLPVVAGTAPLFQLVFAGGTFARCLLLAAALLATTACSSPEERFKKAFQEDWPEEYAKAVMMMPGITDEQLLAIAKDSHRKDVLALAEREALAETRRTINAAFPAEGRELGTVQLLLNPHLPNEASDKRDAEKKAEVERSARIFAKAGIDLGDLAEDADAKRTEVLSKALVEAYSRIEEQIDAEISLASWAAGQFRRYESQAERDGRQERMRILNEYRQVASRGRTRAQAGDFGPDTHSP